MMCAVAGDRRRRPARSDWRWLLDRRPTPLAWRAAALGGITGPVAVGYWIARSRRGWLAVAALAGSWAWLAVIARASRHPPVTLDAELPPPEALPRVSVVVAARDEADVVGDLIADLGAQDLRDPAGTPRFEAIFVDDRSIDGTGDAIRAASAQAGLRAVTRLVRREACVADGKGGALAVVPPETYTGTVAVVLDADARIGPTFLRRAAAYVAAGADAVTARRRMRREVASWLARAQDDEQTVDGELLRGRWALGGCSEFRGNGLVIRRDALLAAGGWRPGELTEDLDLSTRLATARGVGVGWALDLEVGEDPVVDPVGLATQRLRWAEGSIQRYLEHGWRLVRAPGLPWRLRADFLGYGLQLLLPGVLAGALLGAVAHRRPARPAVLAGLATASAAGVAYDALRWETDERGRPLGRNARLRRALRVTAFGGLWVAMVPAAMARIVVRRGPVRYAKTRHVPHVAGTRASAGDGAVRDGAARPPTRGRDDRQAADARFPDAGWDGALPGAAVDGPEPGLAGTEDRIPIPASAARVG